MEEKNKPINTSTSLGWWNCIKISLTGQNRFKQGQPHFSKYSLTLSEIIIVLLRKSVFHHSFNGNLARTGFDNSITDFDIWLSIHSVDLWFHRWQQRPIKWNEIILWYLWLDILFLEPLVRLILTFTWDLSPVGLIRLLTSLIFASCLDYFHDWEL